MTPTRYAFAAFLQSFGVLRKTKRLSDAAFELHLMQDGEEILGACCWQKTEEIEDLSMEYWNLRRMDREEKDLLSKLHAAEDTLRGAQEGRAQLLTRSKDIGQELFQKRDDLFLEIEDLGQTQGEILATADGVKQKHKALKLKFEVLTEEGSDPALITKCREQLEQLKQEFRKNKSKTAIIDQQVREKEETLKGIQEKIETKLEGSKGESTASFTQISKANRDITTYRAELGLLNEEQSKSFREVGRYLNLNAKNQECRKASEGSRGLVEQVRLLFQSVKLNRRLAERVS